MSYRLELTLTAKEDIEKLKKSDTKAFEKVGKLLIELMEHPYTGTGKPELLRHEFSGCYSRRISKKHRLIYSIADDIVTVYIFSAGKHYNDK